MKVPGIPIDIIDDHCSGWDVSSYHKWATRGYGAFDQGYSMPMPMYGMFPPMWGMKAAVS